MNKSLVSIVLLSYNGKNFNKNCIDSILPQTYQNFEIVFVDNKSTDGSLEEVEHLYKDKIKSGKIKIVKNKENGGFTGGNNLGVLNASKESEYICLLNNDTVVPKDWLEKMVRGIQSDNSLGGVSCLILDKGCEDKIKETFLNNQFKWDSSIFGEVVHINMESYDIPSRFFYTTFLSGCCFLYRKRIIKTPFPDYYFIYAEDVWLSRYIVSQGYKLGVYLDNVISHFGSPTFGKKPSPTKLFLGNRNQIINYLVYYPLLYRILLFPIFIIKEIGHLFIGTPFMRLNAKIKSIIWILKNYGKIIETRKFIKNHTKIGPYGLIKQLKFMLITETVIDNKLFKMLIKFGNCLFFVYGKLVMLLLGIFCKR